MKLVKTFLGIIAILLLVYFLTLNDAKVYVDLIFVQFTNASVNMIILGSLALGLIFGYILAVFSILAAKSEIRSLQNKNGRLTEELNDLRNVAIDEGIYDTEDGEY